MTSFDKELTRFLDERGDACDVWAAVRQRAAAGGLLDTPYLPPPVPRQGKAAPASSPWRQPPRLWLSLSGPR